MSRYKPVTFADTLRQLELALAQTLPGMDAQDRMAPRPRREWSGFDSARARRAAGLLLVFPKDERAHIVLTVRSSTLGRHSGQVSLPGGVVEPGETIEEAALREAHEEIGLPLAGVQALGTLTPIDIPVSGFRLHPVVATTPAYPRLRPADGEVARVLEVPVELLMDPQCRGARDMERDGRKYRVPTLVIDGAEVWGATAMVLSEFMALLGWTGCD